MEEKILISVIVPAYNVAPWLPRCLDSILAQTYSRLEVIVVDDGATDETPQIAESYAARDPRIRVIHQPNGGLVAARETGIRAATGAYVAFVDGDDTIEPELYQRLLANALKYDADISHCGVSFCYPDGRKEPHYGTGIVKVQDHDTGLIDLLSGTLVEPGLWNKLYKASLLPDSCLDRSVLNNEDLLRNYILFDRARKSVFEDFCGYLYMQRPGSMSKDQSKYVQSSRHILRARRLIADHAGAEIYPHAMQLWLSTYVNIIQQTLHSADPELKALSLEARQMLKKERKNIRYLIPRQRIAAYLILCCPALHRFVYSLYKR